MANTQMFSTDRTTAHHSGDRSPGARLRTKEGLSWWQAIAAGAVAAAVVNLVIFFIGGAAGASFAFLDRGALHEITAWGVIVATVPPLVIGTGLAALLARWWFGVIRLAQVLGGGIALLTAAGPLMTDADGATRLSLADARGVGRGRRRHPGGDPAPHQGQPPRVTPKDGGSAVVEAAALQVPQERPPRERGISNAGPDRSFESRTPT